MSAPNVRWATVPAALNAAVSRHRHAVERGHPTSACGTTALPAEIWRADSRKPKCPQCLAKLDTTTPREDPA